MAEVFPRDSAHQDFKALFHNVWSDEREASQVLRKNTELLINTLFK